MCGKRLPLRMPEVCSGFARGAVQGCGLEFQPQHGGGPRQVVDEIAHGTGDNVFIS